jgi:glyoxylase I family protein
MALKGMTHISLSVTDLDRSLAFYRDTLGLPVLLEPFEGQVFDGREVMLLVGRTALCLQEHVRHAARRFDPTQCGLDHLAFAVDSLAELRERAESLTAAGVENSGVKPLAGFGEFIELRDPDGIQLELHVTAAAHASQESAFNSRGTT